MPSEWLQAHNASTEGASSLRIARAMLMTEPASIDGNELTDKGYINQRAASSAAPRWWNGSMPIAPAKM